LDKGKARCPRGAGKSYIFYGAAPEKSPEPAENESITPRSEKFILGGGEVASHEESKSIGATRKRETPEGRKEGSGMPLVVEEWEKEAGTRRLNISKKPDMEIGGPGDKN